MTYPIEIKELSFRFSKQEHYLLENINLKLKTGELVGIMGLSGSGKSTLLNIISGVIPHIYQGDILGEVLLLGKSVQDMSIPDICKMLGIVFQDAEHQLFCPSVEDDIAFGPENLCLAPTDIGNCITHALNQTGISPLRHVNPNHLSGGQKQLAALASVLSMQPKILLLDEVMSQIDTHGKQQLKNTLKHLKSEGITTLMVDHDVDNLDIADHIMVIENKNLSPYKPM